MDSRINRREIIGTLDAAKAGLRPLPKMFVECMSLRYHIALEAMRSGAGSCLHLEALINAVALSGFLADAGYGVFPRSERVAVQKAAKAALEVGRAAGRWVLDEDMFDRIAKVLTLHDEQLRTAPFSAISSAGKWIDELTIE